MSKLKILAVCVLFGAPQGIVAMSALKKTAVLGGGLAPAIYMDNKYEQAYREIVPLLPNAKLLPRLYVTAVLLKYCPEEADLITSIQYKKGEHVGAVATNRGPIMFITDDALGDSHSAYLHELAHIRSCDTDSMEAFNKIKAGVIGAGVMHHLLYASGKKRFLTAPLGAAVGSKFFSAVGNIIKYEREKSADQSAWNDLKAQGSTKENLQQLKKTVEQFDDAAFQESIISSRALAHGSVIDQLKARALRGPGYVRAQVDVHPSSSERADKFDALLTELKAQRDSKIKE